MAKPESFAEKAVEFYRNLSLKLNVKSVEVMNPYEDGEVMKIVEQFFGKYFDDQKKRTFIFGINPGRFGAGITGIAFTDPVNLQEVCGIGNIWEKKHELSSRFIYRMIDEYGGPMAFYANHFITAVSPLGFVKEGKNLNYYDQRNLKEDVLPFIVDSVNRQLEIGAWKKVAVCLGSGKNLKEMNHLNARYGWFDEIVPLDHPRFIMQYRRKAINQYVKKYLKALKNCESMNAD
ncbi:MAG: uracil-DNA glycosylase family protein [Bacteroidales bacterium]